MKKLKKHGLDLFHACFGRFVSLVLFRLFRWFRFVSFRFIVSCFSTCHNRVIAIQFSELIFLQFIEKLKDIRALLSATVAYEVEASWIILSISQGSIRVSAVPVRLSTTDAQSAHLSLWQLFPTDFYWWCVPSSGWIKRTRNWFYTRSLSLSKYHQPSRGGNFFFLWLSQTSVLTSYS